MPPITLSAPELRHVNDAPVPSEVFRIARQSADLVRYQSQQQAAWLHTDADADATRRDAWRYWAALALSVLAFAMALHHGPTDAQAHADSAAQVADAGADEWLRAALQANPDLTPEQLARVRAAALLIERGAVQP